MDNRAPVPPTAEHLPEIVHLLAGDTVSPEDIAQQGVHVPVVVAEKSAYLRKRPDVEPAALKIYAWWLKFDDAPLFLHDEHGPMEQPYHTLLWRECFDLVQAHILGSRFDDVDFQRYILVQLDQWLMFAQGPDIELLDHLWGTELGQVSEELLCFVMGRMFQVEQHSARVMVSWMRRLLEEKRMSDGAQGEVNCAIRESDDATKRMPAGATSRSLKPKSKSKRAVHAAKTEDSNPVPEMLSVREPIQRDTTPLSLPEGSSHLPLRLILHPKAVESIENDNLNAKYDRQRTASPQLPPAPNLHPIIQDGLANTEVRTAKNKPRKSSRPSTPAKLRGGSSNISSVRDSDSSPPVRGQRTRLLGVFEQSDDDVGPPVPPKDPPRASRSQRNPRIEPLPISFPPGPLIYSPFAKQVMQAFKTSRSRSPTPRRNSRSWSVGSIRSLEKPDWPVDESPKSGLISRKPVPQSGLEFLGRYVDGETLQRVVSVNSRPGRTRVNGIRRKPVARVVEIGGRMVSPGEWYRPFRRPGTA